MFLLMQYTLLWKLGSSTIKPCSYFLPNCSLTITINVFPEPKLLIQSHNMWISCLRLKQSFSPLHILSDICFLLSCYTNILTVSHFFPDINFLWLFIDASRVLRSSVKNGIIIYLFITCCGDL